MPYRPPGEPLKPRFDAGEFGGVYKAILKHAPRTSSELRHPLVDVGPGIFAGDFLAGMRRHHYPRTPMSVIGLEPNTAFHGHIADSVEGVHILNESVQQFLHDHPQAREKVPVVVVKHIYDSDLLSHAQRVSLTEGLSHMPAPDGVIAVQVNSDKLHLLPTEAELGRLGLETVDTIEHSWGPVKVWRKKS